MKVTPKAQSATSISVTWTYDLNAGDVIPASVIVKEFGPDGRLMASQPIPNPTGSAFFTGLKPNTTYTYQWCGVFASIPFPVASTPSPALHCLPRRRPHRRPHRRRRLPGLQMYKRSLNHSGGFSLLGIPTPISFQRYLSRDSSSLVKPGGALELGCRFQQELSLRTSGCFLALPSLPPQCTNMTSIQISAE